MRTLRFVMFIFYRYYSKGGTKQIPYFSALCATVFLIYLHIFQFLIIFDSVDLLPMEKDNDRAINYLKFALFSTPIFLIIAFLIKERDLKLLDYDNKKIQRGGVYLVVYCITSFILLFILAFAFART